jgi:hypothetical protein
VRKVELAQMAARLNYRPIPFLSETLSTDLSQPSKNCGN